MSEVISGTPTTPPTSTTTPLDHIPLFAPLTAQVRGELSAWMQKRVCAPGEIIFNEGDPGDAMFVVEDGYVSVFVTDQAMGLTVDVASLGRGEAFGEMALVTGEGRWSARACGCCTATCSSASRRRFRRWH